MATKPTANAALREDLIELAAALYLHDHALIRAVYGRHPGLDVMSAAASLFVETKNSVVHRFIHFHAVLGLLNFAAALLRRLCYFTTFRPAYPAATV